MNGLSGIRYMSFFMYFRYQIGKLGTRYKPDTIPNIDIAQDKVPYHVSSVIQILLRQQYKIDLTAPPTSPHEGSLLLFAKHLKSKKKLALGEAGCIFKHIFNPYPAVANFANTK